MSTNDISRRRIKSKAFLKTLDYRLKSCLSEVRLCEEAFLRVGEGEKNELVKEKNSKSSRLTHARKQVTEGHPSSPGTCDPRSGDYEPFYEALDAIMHGSF